MLITWLIGYMFTIGVFISEEEKDTWWRGIVISIFSLILWPLVLGVVFGSMVEDIRKKLLDK